MFDRPGLLGVWAVLMVVGICSCSQGKGEPCQVDADCDSGLVCDARGGARGTCVTELSNDDRDQDEPEPDAGGRPDEDDEDAGG